MNIDLSKIDDAKIIIDKITNGINPLTGIMIEDKSFLNHPGMKRCFLYISDVLEYAKSKSTSKMRLTEFVITPDQKEKVIFPQNEIGVSEFAKCVNDQLDLNVSIKLSGMMINKKLKKLGILSEKTVNNNGRTITNEKSAEFGFKMIHVSSQNRQFDMVVMNDEGKKYLLNNIEEIMSIDDSPESELEKSFPENTE